MKGYFSHIGKVKDFKHVVLDEMKLDIASIKVKVHDDTVIPTYLVVKGVPGNREEVVRWELDYPDKPSICYHCYESGHLRRDCRNPSVPITTLLDCPNLEQCRVKGSYAQAVRSKESAKREKEG